MELNDVLSQSDAIRKEIVNRIHCQVEDFEVVEYDSGGIGIHWSAIYPRYGLIDVPYGWIVAGIYPAENKLAMYADPGDFLCMK